MSTALSWLSCPSPVTTQAREAARPSGWQLRANSLHWGGDQEKRPLKNLLLAVSYTHLRAHET